MNEMTFATLSNGLKVVNFSSPHTFTFTDGTELPACSAERAKGTMLEAIEFENVTMRGDVAIVNIDLRFALTDDLVRELDKAHCLWEAGEVDIIITPLPVMMQLPDVIGSRYDAKDPMTHGFRTIRVADRVTRQIHIDRFCI